MSPLFPPFLLCLLHLTLTLAPDPSTPHEHAEILRLQHEWAVLRASAASPSNLHRSAAAAKVLQHEGRMNQLRATIWTKSHIMHHPTPNRNITLAQIRDVLYHQLHTNSSLTLPQRADVNERLVQIMKQIGRQRKLLHEQLETLQSEIAILPPALRYSSIELQNLRTQIAKLKMELYQS